MTLASSCPAPLPMVSKPSMQAKAKAQLGSNQAPKSKLIQLLPLLPPTHMQISPNVRSNRSRGGGGVEGNFSAPQHPALPAAPGSRCPKDPPASPAPREMAETPPAPQGTGGMCGSLCCRAALRNRRLGRALSALFHMRPSASICGTLGFGSSALWCCRQHWLNPAAASRGAASPPPQPSQSPPGCCSSFK